MATETKDTGGTRTSKFSGGSNRWGNKNWQDASTTKGTTGFKATGGGSNCAPGYRNVFTTFGNKITGYRMLTAQMTGPASFKRPTAATLNSFAKWIDKGAIVNKITSAQICKWTNTNKKFASAATVKNVLCGKWGKTMIKAVVCDKAGNFLVATNPTWKGKSFKFPR
ncbi:MAG: hypothetical protein IID37_15460 [Planctomycetes bacterium]|nr:hypothetical protein [Planctomycetota bacterium]